MAAILGTQFYALSQTPEDGKNCLYRPLYTPVSMRLVKKGESAPL